jgi:hypothetical protein
LGLGSDVRPLRANRNLSPRSWLALTFAVLIVVAGLSVAAVGLAAKAVTGYASATFGSPLLLQATGMPLHTVGKSYGGGVWLLPIDGEIGAYVRFLHAGENRVSVLAKGTPANGVWAEMVLVVDGHVAGAIQETNGQWNAYGWTLSVGAGVHQIAIRYVNDAVFGTQDRNLYVRSVAVSTAGAGAPPRVATHGEWVKSGVGATFGSPLLLQATGMPLHTVGKSYGGGVWLLPIDGEIGAYVRFLHAGENRVSVLAKGTPANGVWAEMVLVVDGHVAGAIQETNGQWNAYGWTLSVGAGVHQIAIRYVNDAVFGTQDRNLYVRSVAVSTAGAGAPPRVATHGEWVKSGVGATTSTHL